MKPWKLEKAGRRAWGRSCPAIRLILLRFSACVVRFRVQAAQVQNAADAVDEMWTRVDSRGAGEQRQVGDGRYSTYRWAPRAYPRVSTSTDFGLVNAIRVYRSPSVTYATRVVISLDFSFSLFFSLASPPSRSTACACSTRGNIRAGCVRMYIPRDDHDERTCALIDILRRGSFARSGRGRGRWSGKGREGIRREAEVEAGDARARAMSEKRVAANLADTDATFDPSTF